MRVEKWDVKLNEVIEAAQGKSFQYGSFDCALFAADCVLAMTGTDYAAELRGYTSKIDAYRIVATYGSLEAMITSLLGREPIHPAFAHRGDVVLGSWEMSPGEEGEAIGICCGVHVACPSETGIRLVQRSSARIAWRVE